VSPIGGVLFLIVGVGGICAVGLIYLTLRERAGQRPKHTVARFQRSRATMRKLYRQQLARREERRQRARAAHPAMAAKARRHRKSA
jgi:hypothetical protein